MTAFQTRCIGVFPLLVLLAACSEPTGAASDSSLDPDLAPGVGTNATPYVATILALPSGAQYSSAYAINNSGNIVGRGWLPNGNQFAVRWNPAGNIATTLAQPAGHISSTANDVNQSGIVVGSFVDHLGWHPVYWTANNVVVRLPDLGGQAAPTAINDAGLMVGHAVVKGRFHMVTWLNGVISDRHPAGYLFSRARDVAENGDIVGYAANGLDTTAYIWHANGTSEAMGKFAGSLTSDSHGVSNNGVAVGASVGPGTSTAFYWSPTSGISNAGFGVNSIAYGVSDKNRITGWSSNPGLAYTRLRNVIDTLPNPLLVRAKGYDVNLCGTVVGNVEGTSIATQRAVKWAKPACD
jgi:uncharacterized membrane protein